MVKVVAFASFIATAAAGACSSDDQAALSDPNTIGKKAGDCGTSAYNVLTGKFDHEKFNPCFTAATGISEGCSECYAKNGEYGAANCKAACLLGWCKQGCLDCTTADEPKAALDACTGFTSGSATPCLSSTGACSSDDQAAISDPNTIGKKAGDCGKSAYNVVTGNFNHDKFNDCLTASAGISAGCSECYAVSGEFGAKNCKAACLLGWCKSGCLDCVKPAQADLDTCTGFTSGSATPCLETEATGACSSDDQAALADAQNVGEKQDACGKKALGLSGIDHDKFTSCVQSDLGISSGCSECYYSVADYGFKNCKAACLLGWCKSGCLSCTQPAQDSLSDCTGFQPAVASPCMDMVV